VVVERSSPAAEEVMEGIYVLERKFVIFTRSVISGFISELISVCHLSGTLFSVSVIIWKCLGLMQVKLT
jgi:hypothetical protein